VQYLLAIERSFKTFTNRKIEVSQKRDMNQAHSHELNEGHFQNESIFSNPNLIFNYHNLSETYRNIGQFSKSHNLKIFHQKQDFSATMHHIKT